MLPYPVHFLQSFSFLFVYFKNVKIRESLKLCFSVDSGDQNLCLHTVWHAIYLLSHIPSPNHLSYRQYLSRNRIFRHVSKQLLCREIVPGRKTHKSASTWQHGWVPIGILTPRHIHIKTACQLHLRVSYPFHRRLLLTALPSCKVLFSVIRHLDLPFQRAPFTL